MPTTLEGCIVRIVDRITYAGRDIEDALVAGQIKEQDIPKRISEELGNNNGEIIGRLLEDLIEYSRKNENYIGLSKEKHGALIELIDFNYGKIYKAEEVEKFKKQATLAIEELFNRLVSDIKRTNRFNTMSGLPDATVYNVLNSFINKVGYTPEVQNEFIVLDFISGMTDNYVIRCLDEIFVPKCIT